MYKTVSFAEDYLGIRRKRTGIRVGNLAVLPEYKQNNGVWHIYSIISCSKFLNPGIEGKELALRIAHSLNKMYGDYLLIPRAWKEADVIMLARYSIPNGLKIYALHELDTVLTEENIKHYVR